ncbi:hypothetical protein GCM10020331_080810 [Ectobacillus funiculus]
MFNVSDVEFALLEPNGTLNIFIKERESAPYSKGSWTESGTGERNTNSYYGWENIEPASISKRS